MPYNVHFSVDLLFAPLSSPSPVPSLPLPPTIVSRMHSSPSSYEISVPAVHSRCTFRSSNFLQHTGMTGMFPEHWPSLRSCRLGRLTHYYSSVAYILLGLWRRRSTARGVPESSKPPQCMFLTLSLDVAGASDQPLSKNMLQFNTRGISLSSSMQGPVYDVPSTPLTSAH